MPRLRGRVPVVRAVRPPDGRRRGRCTIDRRAASAVAPARRGVARLPARAAAPRVLLALTWLARGRAAAAPRAAAGSGCRRSRSGPCAPARSRDAGPPTRTSSPAASWTRGSATCTAPRCGSCGRRGAPRRCPGRAATAAARCTSTPAASTTRARLARRVIASMPGRRARSSSTAPGCGAAMKDYGRLLGTPTRHGVLGRVARLLGVGRGAAAAAAARHRRDRGRPGPVPPPPRPARRRRGAHRARAGVPARSRPTTTACAAAPVVRTASSSRRSPARSATARSPRSGPSPTTRPAARSFVVASANPGCAMHLVAGGVYTCDIPPSCWRSPRTGQRDEES